MKTCTIYGNMSSERTSDNYPLVQVCNECIKLNDARKENSKIVSENGYDSGFGDTCEFCGKTLEQELDEEIQENFMLSSSKFICDSCNTEISTVEEGWVEWINLGMSQPGRDLRLVHNFNCGPRSGGCTFNQKVEFNKDGGTVADMPLSALTGPDGLITLLSFIYDEKLPTNEVLELIKRIHIPGYEFARLHFKEAIRNNVFEPDTAENYYSQSNINATLRYIFKK